MVTDDKHPDRISGYPKQKVKGKSFKVDTAEVPRLDREAFWALRRLNHKASELGIKLVRELPRVPSLIPLHDLVDVRINSRMKDQPHYFRRAPICPSSCSNVMPEDGSLSRSASRRRASAIPSSCSSRTGGSDPSKIAARAARSLSGKSSTNFSISLMVAMCEN